MAEANVTTTKPLPPEVLEKIFKHCGLLNELVNIVDVCHLWRDVAVHQYNTSLKDLVIRRPNDINDLVSLLCKPVNFTKLHVLSDIPTNVDCSSVSLDALADATSLTHLQSFTFKVKDVITFDFIIPDANYDKILDALLTLVLQTSTETLTHFTLINIVECEQTTSRKAVEILQGCQHLSHLVLKGCRVGDEDHQRCVDIIPTLTHLEVLDIDLRDTSFIRFPREHDLSFIAAVKRGCPNISNNIRIEMLCVRPSDDMNMLQFVSHVSRLCIDGLDTDQFTTLLSCLSERVTQMNVDKLNVEECKDHLTDDILLSLAQRLRGLKMVRADECHHLTNEGVANVITSIPELKRINIEGIKTITMNIIPLLDRVVTEQNVDIAASGTKFSDEMMFNPNGRLYTGKNGNMCLMYHSEDFPWPY